MLVGAFAKHHKDDPEILNFHGKETKFLEV